MMNIKLDHSTLQEKVTSTLRHAVLTKKYTAGERLVQDGLANWLGVSRMPIREALRCLEREGLVEMLPHKGAVVTEISAEDIEELYFLRSLLEGLTVQKSMYYLTLKDREELEKLVECMDIDITNQDHEKFVKHNHEFHQLLQKGCKWKKIKMLCQELWNGYPAYVPSLLPETIQVSNEEHKRMLKALDLKDPIKLRNLVEQHVSRSGEALTAYLYDHHF